MRNYLPPLCLTRGLSLILARELSDCDHCLSYCRSVLTDQTTHYFLFVFTVMSLIINYDILLVVEVFQSWAGPCECIKPMLYRTSLDNEDIKFCCAAADKIGSLKEYKDKLKPVFLFYKVTLELVAKIRC
mmetsp:Transcript_6718/g.23643  ORF Transcript_6718/g.23643 Transcript_6718/m.23643 type:complete len:130 (+) Transcript_6718:87-476(+)